MLRRFAGLTALALLAAPALFGLGSPPLITDDPGTPGDGHWEINVGFSTERRACEQSSETPLLDFNYGIGPALQLKYEIPFLVVHDDDGHRSGFGNSEVGIKWRFLDGGDKGAAVSIYPQWEFPNPGAGAAGHGLVEPGSALLLPVQLEKELGAFTLNLQLGREFRSRGDTWSYGCALSRALNETLEVGVELAGRASPSADRSSLAANFGVAVKVDEHSSLMFSAGAECHDHFEPRASLLAYVGWQLRL